MTGEGDFAPGRAQKISARRAIGAATVGNALEFYDFITFAYFAIQIGHTFFPSASAYGSLMLALATFGVGFVTRPLGGIVIGALSDRVGRRPAMMASFMMMGGSLVALALIPSYAVIGIWAPILAVVARMVQGFALGGEVGPTTAFLLEAAPPEQRGFYVSWQGASQAVAAAVAGLVGLTLSSTLSHAALDSYGWRIAFLLGAVTLPFGLWIRTALPETLHDIDTHVVAVSRGPRVADDLRQNWRIILVAFVVLATATIGTYLGNYLVTFTQNTLHMPARIAFTAEVLRDMVTFVTALLGGWLSDRIGRRPMVFWPRLAVVVMIYPVYYWIVETRSAMALFVGYTALAAAGGLWGGAFYAAFSESLPKRIRGSAFATIYAVAISIFGGTTQLTATWLLHVTGNPMALAWYLLTASSIGTIATLFLLESAPVRIAPQLAAAAAT